MCSDSTAVLQSISEDGYAIVSSLVKDDQLSQFESDMKVLALRQTERCGGTASVDLPLSAVLRNLAKLNLGAYFATLRMCESLYSLYRIATNDGLSAVAKALRIEVPVFPINLRVHIMDAEINDVLRAATM